MIPFRYIGTGFFMPQSRLKYFILLHITVFIFGFTGILGKQITMDQPELDSINVVLYRMIIAAAGLWFYMKLMKIKFKAPSKERLKMIGVGGLIAAHWITFFASIEESNVSVALACISSATLFTSVLEPLILKRKFDPSELFIGIATIIGIYIITVATSKDGLDYTLGIVLSVISAFLAALFGVINAKLGVDNDPEEISMIEMISGAVFTFLFALVSNHHLLGPSEISDGNWFRLILLGLLATSFAFVATVAIMRVLTPFTVALSINLEPIYAIILALILFPQSEKMVPLFYVGASIIIGSIAVNAVLKKRRRQKVKKLGQNHSEI